MGKTVADYTELVAQWHPTKNNGLTPSDVSYGSGKKIWWTCSQGHEWLARVNNRTNQKHGCPECYRINFVYTLEEVKDIFTKEGCILNSTEYINARKKLSYTCSCGRNSEIALPHFLNGHRCKGCQLDGNRKSYEVVKQVFKDGGCTLLATEYVKNEIPLKYRCSCGRESKISLSNFLKGKRCKECGRKKCCGENNHKYNPDREYIREFLIFKKKCHNMIHRCLEAVGYKKDKHSYELLGYTSKQFWEHITNHPNWMLVKDYNWHIDHIFPISACVKHGVKDLKIINALDNLQPMIDVDNMSKGDKYDKDDLKLWLETKGVFI